MKKMFYVAFVTLIGFVASIATATSAATPTEFAEVDKCTSVILGPLAGTSGPMTTHLADCSDCDFRLNKVPAKDWPANSMRPLYLYKGNYPSLVTSRRGSTWHPDNLEGTPEQLAAWGKESVITGYVPQVAHTYALYEAGYGIMNEHQVAIGESTCASKLWAAPVIAGGKARIEAREMTMIALERCTTARCAVQTMGDLAVEYGFYAADWSGGDASKGEGGEGLTVVDKTEAWVFHVLADDTGASAVWVAQRLEDDHVSVIANQFVIRTIDRSSDRFLFSDNLWEVASRQGFWSPEHGALDFLLTYGPKRAHSPYATRRVWRVFNLVAPSLILPGDSDPYASNYPFSVKVEKRMDVADVMAVLRDHYEGSIYDLTQGLAAGPFGDPNRFDAAPTVDNNLTFSELIQGSYERSISLFRTSYSFVAPARASVDDSLSLLWFAQHAPSGSSYAPLYVASPVAPTPYSRGTLFQYDDTVAFWNFVAVANYAARFYRYAMVDVRKLQADLYTEAVAAIDKLEARCSALLTVARTEGTVTAVKAMAATLSEEQALRVTSAWRTFLPKLITLYHDGYHAENLDGADIKMTKLFYTKTWLDATGFWNNKPNTGSDVILFSSGYLADQQITVGVAIVFVVIASLLSAGITAALMMSKSRRDEKLLKNGGSKRASRAGHGSSSNSSNSGLQFSNLGFSGRRGGYERIDDVEA